MTYPSAQALSSLPVEAKALPRKRRSVPELAFLGACFFALAIPLLTLGVIFADALIDAWPRLTTTFLTGFPSRDPEKAGIAAALAGSAMLMVLTAIMVIPVGVGAAIYLEEYARASRIARLIELNIANLAGVPSIIYGLLGLGLFVRTLGLGRSILAGACTLALLLLPMVVLTSREALRTVPRGLREAGWALGGGRWATLRHIVLPTCLPGIMTGLILGLARAIGETAPLITIGALTYVATIPTTLDSPFTAIPVQVFNWVSRPQVEFQRNAAAGIVVLLALLLILNSVAIFVRIKLQKRQQ